jgi:hypothetical protein
VDGRRLHDRAAGRGQPPEALDGGEEADGARLGAAGADAACGLQVGAHGLGVEAGIQVAQAVRIEVDAGVEEARLLAVKDHPSVYELPAFYPGNDAQ